CGLVVEGRSKHPAGVREKARGLFRLTQGPRLDLGSPPGRVERQGNPTHQRRYENEQSQSQEQTWIHRSSPKNNACPSRGQPSPGFRPEKSLCAPRTTSCYVRSLDVALTGDARFGPSDATGIPASRAAST